MGNGANHYLQQELLELIAQDTSIFRVMAGPLFWTSF
jgi:hypothetical protein